MKYIVNPSVTIITPSTGSTKLTDCIESVVKQTYENLRHLVVYDGKKNNDLNISHTRLDICELPYNTGINGFYGHRIYAAFPQLIDSDFICFLDEDNWFKRNHIESLINMMLSHNDLSFVHSLRDIYNKDGNFLISDNCESLGRYPVYLNQDTHLVDTSSYMFRTSFLKEVSYIWNYGWGADRHFFHTFKDKVNYDCSGFHTLCYRLEGNENSVSFNFFEHGNKVMKEQYNGIFPWKK